MGHYNKKNLGSLAHQVQTNLDSMLAIGESKHVAKIAGNSYRYIYSWNTYRTYLKHACYFVTWCKDQYGCKTLDDCKSYAAAWIATRSHLSAYTQKLEASALTKLYQCSVADLNIKTSSRKRANIKRSRGSAKRDKHFNENTHAELVAFCRSTGLRRAELKALRGVSLYLDTDGQYYIHVISGSKGGRERYAPVIGNIELVCNLCRNAGENKVFSSIPSAADIHSYRAEYATQIYLQHARPLEQLERQEKYYCRGDRKGEIFDRVAMQKASQALGHNRISVVAAHYLRM